MHKTISYCNHSYSTCLHLTEINLVLALCTSWKIFIIHHCWFHHLQCKQLYADKCISIFKILVLLFGFV